ncbi:hypothetical protein AURDEDRAFT_161603 [Auricularia subglabra TFB-10046 SS5]|nr:hypothetical protein AURDEDRAFT_161603 [Auricularia subglabra TFB-10046 SS5]
MRTFTLTTVIALAVAAFAQPGTPLKGSANILVSSRQDRSTAETAIGCLNAEGQVVASTTACATFSVSAKTSRFGGTAVDAGKGVCGFIPKNPHGPLGCNATVPEKYVLGFYELDGKLAVQELFTEWSIDAAPTGDEAQVLYKQGLHALRAVLYWTPV